MRERAAIPKISKELRKITFSIEFDKQFGAGFDLGDQISR